MQMLAFQYLLMSDDIILDFSCFLQFAVFLEEM